MDDVLCRRVVETMSEGLAVRDVDGRLVFVNAALCRLGGYAEEELIGQPSETFVAPRLQGEFHRQLAIRRSGASDPYETVVVGRDGGEIPVLVSPQPLFDAQGSFCGSFAVVSDIRQSRRAELEREVISEIVRGVVETANVDDLLALIHRSLSKVIYAENCFVALLNEASDSIEFPYFVDKYDCFQEPIRRGRTCTDYVLRTGRPLLLSEALFERLLEAGEVELVGANSPSWMGVPLVTPTRTIGVLAVQHYEDEGAFSKRDLEFFGSVAGHIALAIERKRAEEQIHANRELYTNVVESMSDGVFVLDPSFRFLSWNRTMEELTHVVREEVLGHGALPWEIFPHLRELGVDRMMRGAMAGEPQTATHLEHELADGTRRVTQETYRPLRSPDGAIRGVVGVVRDVTDRRAAEEALRRSEEQLRQAQKMEAIGRLAGGIAHDFNNLLTAINGYSEFLIQGLPERDPLRADLAQIHKAGEHAAELTRQLLAFSRRQMIQPEVFDLNAKLAGLESMLRRLLGEDVELMTELEPGLAPIKTDPGQIEQVVINLVVNAREAMPQGGRIGLRTANRERFVLLEVSDTGTGMEPEVQERIFEPFFTTKEVGQGTGMGLSTVYGIVKQNGGRVAVDSAPGRGTTLSVFLPATRDPQGSTSPGPGRAEDLSGAGRVLVVEDEDSVRSLTRMILERHGYRVLAAGSGDEALELCSGRSRPVDLLLSDVVMPRMSGPELAARLQLLYPDLKVLFISGHADETILRHGVLMPDVELLIKPFRIQDLLSRVRKVLYEWRPGADRVAAGPVG